jgi:small subunit ribosomal protein S5
MTEMQTGPRPQRDRQGGRSQRDRGGVRPPRGGDEQEDRAFDEEVVKIYRCSTVVKGGRRFSFAALVVMGDRQGKVGIGYGKAVEVPSAVEKGKKAAMRALSPIKVINGTLPHRVVGRFGASKVVMVPASPGTGVIAGASVRAVLELAGVKDVLTKSYGSNSPKNLVRAVFNGLQNMLDRSDVERLRGVRLAS